MKIRYSLLCAVLLLTAYGCDSDSPTSSNNSDLTAPLTGRVILMRDCDTLQDHSGGLIRTQLGATAVTDVGGNFTIQVPLWQSNVSFTKDGFYPDDFGEFNWVQDSGKFVSRAPNIMNGHSRYSAKFVIEPKVTRETVIESRWAQVDSSGVLVTRRIQDTLDLRFYFVSTVPIDGSDQPTSAVRSILLFSQEPNIDPASPNSYQHFVDAYGPDLPHKFSFDERILRSYGIDPDKRFYLAVTSYGPCAGYRQFGVRPSEIKRVDP